MKKSLLLLIAGAFVLASCNSAPKDTPAKADVAPVTEMTSAADPAHTDPALETPVDATTANPAQETPVDATTDLTADQTAPASK